MILPGYEPRREYIMDANGITHLETDHEAFIRWFSTTDLTLAYVEIDAVKISTVFIPIDMRLRIGDDDRPPLLFETMIFGGKHDLDAWRYATRTEALMGHKRAVDLVTAEATSPDRAQPT